MKKMMPSAAAGMLLLFSAPAESVQPAPAAMSTIIAYLLSDPAQRVPLETVTTSALGQRLFFDANLSLNRSMSCATCHDPAHAFIDARFHTEPESNPVNGALSVGDDGTTLGGRNSPTLLYALRAPAFATDPRGNALGGQFHDGRAADLQAQAKGPFVDPAEMMMPDAASVIERVMENSGYAADFKTLYGEEIFNDADAAYDALAECIAAFEATEPFAPFDSKYDRFVRGDYNMSALEQQGYTLFFSPQTNCAACHALNPGTESAGETFTNFRYENIGVPPNLGVFAAKGIAYAPDLGLGGRTDINNPDDDGKMKVPSLRNVAVTGPYMHNGVFSELRTVLAFYDHMSGHGGHPDNPETGEPWGNADVARTVNLALLRATQPLTNDRIDALLAFLRLLTDERYEGLLDP